MGIFSFLFYEDLVLRGAMHSVQCVRVAGVGAAATQLLTPTPLSPQTAAAVAGAESGPHQPQINR